MSQLDPIQSEQLREVGALLRQQREEKKMTLEEITAKTYIPTRILQALEEGQSDHLPELVFVQGFIKRYGNVLGLDGAALSHQISTKPPNFSVGEHPLSVDESQPHFEYKPVYTSYIVAAAVVIAVGLAFPWIQSGLSSLKVQKRNSVVATPQAIPSPPKSSVSPSPSPVPSDSVEVQVTLTGESWLKVVADDKTEYEGILPKGTQRTWKARQRLTIESGNAGAVIASFNAGTPQALGQPGEVRRVTFKKVGEVR